MWLCFGSFLHRIACGIKPTGAMYTGHYDTLTWFRCSLPDWPTVWISTTNSQPYDLITLSCFGFMNIQCCFSRKFCHREATLCSYEFVGGFTNSTPNQKRFMDFVYKGKCSECWMDASCAPYRADTFPNHRHWCTNAALGSYFSMLRWCIMTTNVAQT